MARPAGMEPHEGLRGGGPAARSHLTGRRGRDALDTLGARGSHRRASCTRPARLPRRDSNTVRFKRRAPATESRNSTETNPANAMETLASH